MAIDRLCDGTWIAAVHATAAQAPPTTVSGDKIACARAEIAISTTIIHANRQFDRINVAHLRHRPNAVATLAATAVEAPSLHHVVIHHHQLKHRRQIDNNRWTLNQIHINCAKVKVQTVAIPHRYALSIKFFFFRALLLCSLHSQQRKKIMNILALMFSPTFDSFFFCRLKRSSNRNSSDSFSFSWCVSQLTQKMLRSI